jgi:hypothetical protein
MVPLARACISASQIKRPSKYDAHTAMMLGPTTPDPTIDLRGLTMVKQAGVGGIGEMGMPITGRYERNWNTLYVGGLPMDWGEMQVRGADRSNPKGGEMNARHGAAGTPAQLWRRDETRIWSAVLTDDDIAVDMSSACFRRSVVHVLELLCSSGEAHQSGRMHGYVVTAMSLVCYVAATQLWCGIDVLLCLLHCCCRCLSCCAAMVR